MLASVTHIRMGGAERNPSSLFITALPVPSGHPETMKGRVGRAKRKGLLPKACTPEKHPDGEKNSHFVIPSGLLSRDDGPGNLSASQKLSRMGLMVRKCI